MTSSSMSSFKVSSMMSSLAGRLISGRVRLLARSRFQSRRSRSMLSLAHRLAVDVRCRRRLVGRVVCLAMLHVLDARAVDVNVSPLSLHLDFQVPLQGFSILFMWPCCMSSMLGPWTTVACRSTQLRHIISASSAMLIRGLLVIVDRGQAMLHAADARAVNNSCPLSCCAVICASSAMLTRSRVHCSPFMLLSSIVLVVVIILSHCRVPVLYITISAMQSRSRTIMPMSIFTHSRGRGPFSLASSFSYSEYC